ncbi:MAG: helix-turn-helix transcriptional regulator [Clostridia bacterium]|nr:helix-turn-helix transcriptional regulator [Clostridia bacterium]
MEFHEKLQELRKQKGLTQEELASALFVSRTAVSKWESGRGYPNIDSLKTTAAFFGITIDELLSSDELLTLAEEDNRQTKTHFRDLVFGLLDSSAAMMFFLPFFGQSVGETIEEVSLLSLVDVSPWLKTAYIVVVAAMIVTGVLTLALQTCCHPLWVGGKVQLSLILNVVGAALFIVSLQPYAALLLFVFLTMKVLLLVKRR